jgi:AP-3 complex subunit beta
MSSCRVSNSVSDAFFTFVVQTLDPPFTRLIKIDILVSLALEPAAIEAVLNELRTYIRHGDKSFATAAIRAVGRVVELARIVYDRHGESNGMAARERQAGSRIALDALHGLSIVTQVSESKAVVGEAVSVMQSILLTLCSSTTLSDGSTFVLEDPNEVRAFAMRRILLLLVGSLSNRQKSFVNEIDENSDEDEEEVSELESISIDLNSAALSSALWIVGEWMANTPLFGASTWMHGSNEKARAKQELLRLIDSCFPHFKSFEKEQAIHFASKIWASNTSSTMNVTSSSDVAICEHILAMGRLDVNPNVKDRARFESCLLHTSSGLKYDANGIDEQPGGASLDQAQAMSIILANKPSSSYLPIEDNSSIDLTSFRFGTLSSLVGHQARGASTALPPWAKKNSPMALREPIEAAKEQLAQNFSDPNQVTGFYDNDDNSSESSSDDSSDSDSSSSSSGSSSDSSDSESESDDDSSSSSDDDGDRNFIANAPPLVTANTNIPNNQLFQPTSNQKAVSLPQPFGTNPLSNTDSSSDDSSSSDDDSSDESDSMPVDSFGQKGATSNPSMGDGNLLGIMSTNGFSNGPKAANNFGSSAMDDLKGLVMAPIQVEDPKSKGVDLERDSSGWIQFVKPEICGGLSVQARYLRGPTKENELRMRNIDPSKANAVCLQLCFSNK